MQLSLDHLHIQSSDPDATTAFLSKMFDATTEWVVDFGAVVVTRMHLVGSHINIFHRAPTVDGPVPEAATIHHFAIATDDFAAAVAQLRERGANIVDGPRKMKNMDVVFISGPDNLLIEILHGAP
jgi:catechol 2,3-dioxygenase-like lactoylglutathione lyase family enzyme